jgi:hypothetical protein
MSKRNFKLKLASKAVVGPLLQSYLDSGQIWIVDGEYLGRAADGVEVGLGIVGGERTLENYLVHQGGPEAW